MDTTHSSYHFALVFFPWATPYPVEGVKNTESLQPIVYTTGTNVSPSGITSVQYSRGKSPGGMMTIEYTGYINAEDKITVGTWCVLSTNSKHPMRDASDVQSKGLVRFIGQVHEISVDYLVVPESGRVARKVIMTVREWSHVLHCPVRYHPSAQEGGLTKVGTASTLGDNAKTRGDIIQRIGSSVSNVFMQPALSLAWVGALNKKSDDLLFQFKNLTSKELSLFPKVVARLPAIPMELIHFVFDKSSDKPIGATPSDAWSSGLLTLLSGVQKWSSSGGFSFFGSGLEVDHKAKRPMSPTVLDFFNEGGSLYEIITKQTTGGGGVEVFPDIWYTQAMDNSWKPRPVLVVRDVPFTLASQKSNYEWTVYDDLPRVRIDSSRILRVSLRQTAQNTATIVQIMPASGDWTKVASAAQISYFGTSIMPSGQERFGAQSRTTMIRDLYVTTGGVIGDKDLKPYENDQEAMSVIKEKARSNSMKVDITQWFNELRLKHRQWYGADYLYPSCTLLTKDKDDILSVGINVVFDVPSGLSCVGHCESVSQSFSIDASGRVVNQTSINLSRLCVVGFSGKLEPMAYETLVNLLRRDTKALTVALDNQIELISQEAVSNITVDTLGTIKGINEGKTKNAQAVKEKKDTSRDLVSDKAPNAQSVKLLTAASAKQNKRKPKND